MHDKYTELREYILCWFLVACECVKLDFHKTIYAIIV